MSRMHSLCTSYVQRVHVTDAITGAINLETNRLNPNAYACILASVNVFRPFCAQDLKSRVINAISSDTGYQGWSPVHDTIDHPGRADQQGHNQYGPVHGAVGQPLTAEEADWEWQRQLDQQEESQEEDEW